MLARGVLYERQGGDVYVVWGGNRLGCGGDSVCGEMGVCMYANDDDDHAKGTETNVGKSAISELGPVSQVVRDARL